VQPFIHPNHLNSLADHQLFGKRKRSLPVQPARLAQRNKLCEDIAMSQSLTRLGEKRDRLSVHQFILVV
jgi:hypothetical protein